MRSNTYAGVQELSLKTEIIIEKCDAPFCVIHAEEENDSIRLLQDKISLLDVDGRNFILNGWDGDFCIQLKPEEIFRIYSMDKKIFITSEKETFLLKSRMYEIEERLLSAGMENFIRISNTDIVNFRNVLKLDMSISGVIKVLLKNGDEVFVSRRYMSKIRSKLCLKK